MNFEKALAQIKKGKIVSRLGYDYTNKQPFRYYIFLEKKEGGNCWPGTTLDWPFKFRKEDDPQEYTWQILAGELLAEDWEVVSRVPEVSKIIKLSSHLSKIRK